MGIMEEAPDKRVLVENRREFFWRWTGRFFRSFLLCLFYFTPEIANPERYRTILLSKNVPEIGKVVLKS